MTYLRLGRKIQEKQKNLSDEYVKLNDALKRQRYSPYRSRGIT